MSRVTVQILEGGERVAARCGTSCRLASACRLPVVAIRRCSRHQRDGHGGSEFVEGVRVRACALGPAVCRIPRRSSHHFRGVAASTEGERHG